MPTVDELTLRAEDGAGELQGALAAVEQAISEGDLSAADERLEGALGQVLAGRGDDEEGRRFNLLAAILWIWSLILLLLFLVSLF